MGPQRPHGLNTRMLHIVQGSCACWRNRMPKVAPLRLYGKRGCPTAYAIRDFLQRSDIPFEWIELRDNEHARNELGLENVDDARLPICIFDDGTRMERPSVRQI